MSKVLISLCLCGLLAACANDTPRSDLERCTDPRPQICTREYSPVCATLTDGSRKTYANGCTACADTAVIGWIMSPCDQP